MRFSRQMMPMFLLAGVAAIADTSAPNPQTTTAQPAITPSAKRREIAAQGAPADDPLQTIRVFVKNNRLVFATRADYERVVDESKSDVRARVITRLRAFNGFTSLAATPPATERMAAGGPHPSTLITEDDLRSILNPDLVVQIGDHILKINPVTEKVYALPATREAEYNDLLAERTSNRNIREFSTSEAVLDLLTSDQSTRRCRESGIHWQWEEKLLRLAEHVMTARLRYKARGIHFSLEAKGLMPPDALNPQVTVDLAPVYYRVRCGHTVGPYSVSNHDITSTGEYQSYWGSAPLNEVYLRARFHAKLRSETFKTDVTNETPWFYISVNYTPPKNLPPDGLDYPHNPSTYTIGQYSVSRPTLARGPVTSWSITPGLPPGLVLNPTTGVIDGVPTSVEPAADRTITAANAYGSTTKLLRMAAVKLPTAPSNLVYPGNPATYVMNTDIVTNQPKYSGWVTSWSVMPALPPGLQMQGGDIWGRPTTAQPARTYTITAKNAGGSTTATLTIEVRDPGAALSGLTYSQNPATYTVGTQIPINKPRLTMGVASSGFTVTPTLPDGLTLATSTGEIWGTPTRAQPPTTYKVTARGLTNQIPTFVQLVIAINEPNDTSD